MLHLLIYIDKKNVEIIAIFLESDKSRIGWRDRSGIAKGTPLGYNKNQVWDGCENRPQFTIYDNL
jgi:hypothetical protein